MTNDRNFSTIKVSMDKESSDYEITLTDKVLTIIVKLLFGTFLALMNM